MSSFFYCMEIIFFCHSLTVDTIRFSCYYVRMLIPYGCVTDVTKIKTSFQEGVRSNAQNQAVTIQIFQYLQHSTTANNGIPEI